MKKRVFETNAKIFRTGLGWAGVAVSDAGITRIILPKADRKAVVRELRGLDGAAVPTGLLERAVLVLGRFFAGEQALFDLPLDLRYYTPFQQSVWRATASIPFGETRSYQWIANRIRRPHAARAVGQAVGANPAPVIIPCHRVITSSGRLGGFSGGLAMKKKLLELESRG